jgi:hypothetical protein
MSAQFASALDPYGREAYEQALGIPSGSMLDALPYAAWSEAQQLNALAGQTTPEPVQATPATKPDHDRVVETTGLCTPDNPFGLEEMELAAVRYYYWQDIPRLSTENFSDPMMMHLEEVMPQERDAWLDSLEGPQMRSLSNEEYQASIEATRAIERQKDEAVWRDSFHYKAAFSLQDAEMMAAADVAFAPLAARIGQGLSKLYWGVRGEQAATNAALRAEFRMALEADFKFYTGSVPTTSVVQSKLGTVLEPRLGSLKGLPEAAPPGANQDMIRAIARQNESAELLAQRGLNVEYLPNTGKPGPNPDLSINGNTADVYSPYSKNPNTIRDNIAYKVENQASNIVLNLSDSPLSSNKIMRFLQENPVEGLQQLYTIKHGEVILRNWK